MAKGRKVRPIQRVDYVEGSFEDLVTITFRSGGTATLSDLNWNETQRLAKALDLVVIQQGDGRDNASTLNRKITDRMASYPEGIDVAHKYTEQREETRGSGESGKSDGSKPSTKPSTTEGGKEHTMATTGSNMLDLSNMKFPDDTNPDGLAAARQGLGVPSAKQVEGYVQSAVTEGLSRLDVQPIIQQYKIGDLPEVKVEGSAHKLLPKVVDAVYRGLNVMLVGPAGSGKTTLAEQTAEVLSENFVPISCAPTPQGGEIMGFRDATGTIQSTPVRESFKAGGVVLFDEIDISYPGTLVQLNNLLSSRTGQKVMFAGEPEVRSERFYGIAAANTYGNGANALYSSRSKLDAATRNRFIVIVVDYDVDHEVRLALATHPKGGRVAELLQSWRTAMVNETMQEVLSTRNILNVCTLLHSDLWSEDDLLDSVVFPGWSDDQRRKVGAPVSGKGTGVFK